MTKTKRLTTFDLKQRGWTPAMIRDLLGQPDATRPSELRVGSRSRRVDAQVKLYNEDRVVIAESTEKFARHQEAARARQDAAEKALATREAQHDQAVAEYLAAPFGLERHPNTDGMTQGELYQHHRNETFESELRLGSLLCKVPRAKARAAEGKRWNAYLFALYDLYGWEYQPWMKERAAEKAELGAEQIMAGGKK